MSYSFENITTDNLPNYKRLWKIYADYKFKTLRNHGEKILGKRKFLKVFNETVKSKDNQFIAMNYNNEFLGFAVISTSSKDMIDISCDYGTVKDFYILPPYRRKGYGKILNDYIENIFIQDGIDTVLLYPDPVTGFEFWKAMGYEDTGIHNGRGKWQVYIKNLKETDNANEIMFAISKLLHELYK